MALDALRHARVEPVAQQRAPALKPSSWVTVPAVADPTLQNLAIPASAPPSESEPVSPMKILAGEAFHHRKPMQAPAMDAQMAARSSGSRTV